MVKFKDVLKTSRGLISSISLFLFVSSCNNVKEPEPIYPIPEAKQVEWQKMETYAFVHFGLNTFVDKEWGYGDTDPSVFAPKKLDCEQWVKTFKQAGMKGVIFTAKHHDGFCLWPTHLTEYCIRNTPYQDGKGDVVGELAAACKKYGLKLALYLSPWDRHHPQYATPEYVDYFHTQLRELMSSYGDVFEVWFDGANGGDGWYGGACDRRNIDRKNYYNYPKIYEILDELQPQAVVFSDGGPGCRWVGNEKGFAGATNWSFIRSNEVYPGYEKYKELQYGHPNGDAWVPAECDVSIRPGWFYHKSQDDKVKSVPELVDLYYRSVGHNATLLLNFPVDTNGLVNPIDSTNAVNFHKAIETSFAHNLFADIIPQATNIRGDNEKAENEKAVKGNLEKKSNLEKVGETESSNFKRNRKFSTNNVTDNNWDTYWATDDDVLSADLVFSLPEKQAVNCLLLQEYIPLGQRVKSYKIEYLQSDDENAQEIWNSVSCKEENTTIGYKRLVRFDTIWTTKIKIRFLDSRGPLCINNIEAYYTGETSLPKKQTCENFQSLEYKIVSLGQNEDELVLDLGKVCDIKSMFYFPKQSGSGVIYSYKLFAGISKENITTEIASGEFSNIRNNPILQEIFFTPQKVRYLRLKAVSMVKEGERPEFEKLGVR